MGGGGTCRREFWCIEGQTFPRGKLSVIQPGSASIQHRHRMSCPNHELQVPECRAAWILQESSLQTRALKTGPPGKARSFLGKVGAMFKSRLRERGMRSLKAAATRAKCRKSRRLCQPPELVRGHACVAGNASHRVRVYRICPRNNQPRFTVGHDDMPALPDDAVAELFKHANGVLMPDPGKFRHIKP